MSNFRQDLNKERILGAYLDKQYPVIFEPKGFEIERVSDKVQQNQGIDLILKKGDKFYHIDEKAQLDYIDRLIPTFAFEISFLIHDNWRQGWLYDSSKTTDIYFLITDICGNKKGSAKSGFKSAVIRGIYRKKLISFLEQKGLNKDRLLDIEHSMRRSEKHGRHTLVELDEKTEGYMFYSYNNKSEKPINLILKLDLLCNGEIGKVIKR